MIVDCALDRQASYSVRGRKVLSCEIEVMRSLATRLAGKSFPRAAKYFALQNAAVTMAQHTCHHPLASSMHLIHGSAMLEVALRNPYVVALKNRNGGVERVGLFRAST